MREALLQGELPYPGSALLIKYKDQKQDILAFWNAVWLNFLNDQETNGLSWYEKLGCKLYNQLVRGLSHHGWIVSNSLTGRRWASAELNPDRLLEFITEEELLVIKENYKYKKYLLTCEDSTCSELVRQNSLTRKTGLVRKGFRDAGRTQFGYDMASLDSYRKPVTLNITKSMDKIRAMYPEMKADQTTYDNVCTGIYSWHSINYDEVFTTGNNINDSRGRAISNALTKVMNPISLKDARAALVITYE